jgi:hypothetical protein
VEWALDELNRVSPVLVAYHESQAPPPPRSPRAEPGPYERTRTLLIDALVVALSEAERAGQGDPLEDRRLLFPLMDAADAAALREALRGFSKAVAGREVLKAAIAAKVLPVLERPGEEAELRAALRAQLE